MYDAAAMTTDDGASDDLRIYVGLDESTASLVGWMTTALAEGQAWPAVRGVLTRRFALSFEDARVGVDRLQAGVVRARDEAPGNEPDATLDPVAWHAYQLARGQAADAPGRGSAAWLQLCSDVASDLPAAIAASVAPADLADDERAAVAVWRAAITGQPVAPSVLGPPATWRLMNLVDATMTATPEPPIEQRGDVAVAAALALAAQVEALLAEPAAPRSPGWAIAASMHELAHRLEDVFDQLEAPTLARQAAYLRAQIAFRLLRTCPVRRVFALLACARRDHAADELAAAAKVAGELVGHVAPLLDEVEANAADDLLDDEPRLMLIALRGALDLQATLGDESGAPLRDRVATALTRPGE